MVLINFPLLAALSCLETCATTAIVSLKEMVRNLVLYRNEISHMIVMHTCVFSGVCPQQGLVCQLFCLLYLQHQAHPEVSHSNNPMFSCCLVLVIPDFPTCLFKTLCLLWFCLLLDLLFLVLSCSSLISSHCSCSLS